MFKRNKKIELKKIVEHQVVRSVSTIPKLFFCCIVNDCWLLCFFPLINKNKMFRKLVFQFNLLKTSNHATNTIIFSDGNLMEIEYFFQQQKRVMKFSPQHLPIPLQPFLGGFLVELASQYFLTWMPHTWWPFFQKKIIFTSFAGLIPLRASRYVTWTKSSEGGRLGFTRKNIHF